MIIKEINIENFRNYSNLSLKPSENINIFYGKNAAGKTNILEGISMLISGKSFRTSRDKEILKFGEDNFQIDALIDIDGLEKDYYLEYDKFKKKKIKVNLSNINSLKDLRRQSQIVTFIPEDLEIIKDGPSLRRKYIDNAISNLDLIYRYNLSKYNKILKEKNELLKKRNKNLNVKLLFEAYNIQLASLGSYIVLSRINFVKNLNEEIKDIHFNISDGDEILTFNYISPLSELTDIKEIEKEMLIGFRNALEKDLYLKYSTYGPQRDDLEILANDKELKIYGSQGQKRSTVLSMKIAEIKLIKKRRNTSPILLLDDVFSELDPLRKKRLLENIDGIQSFISMAEKKYLEDFKDIKTNIYLVKNNSVEKVNGGNDVRKQ